MSEDLPGRLALRDAPAQGDGHGHADDKQERGEHQIHEGHAAAPAMTVAEMHHPIGHDLAGAGEVVHEDHHEHHETAQRIDGRDARGLGGRRVIR